ncbi:TaqI-like C-terminal specificity domain-containing protein [Prevotella denticola]|uniref:TaqI-like C-terminal specificity domain-containing protein n=1 Tax=Prevotella denticola TaxID=28129 RepID=UPI0004924AB4|nr:TaqI-like C-terminal specificity domain-containing protein [Prevotella denticola]
MRIFVQQELVMCDFNTADSWVILSPIEQSIKRKIEAVGIPLKDWDINIYRGVLTGCNEAFIINSTKRKEILANCQSAEEKERTEELIRPILRGRDIKRYGYEWADLWLIYIPWHFPYQFDNSIQGTSEKAERAFKEQYPAVYSHMLQYKDPLSKRNKAETGIRYEWYAMQRWGAKYWDLFFQPHICWKAVGRNLTFSIVSSGTFLTAPASFISAGSRNDYILAYLCSKVGRYYIYQNSDTTGAGDIMLNIQSLIRFPIPPVSNPKIIENSKVLQNHFSQEIQETLDSLIYDSYGFSKEEIEEIERC